MENASEIFKDDDLLEPWDWDVQEDGLWIPPSKRVKLKNIDKAIQDCRKIYDALPQLRGPVNQDH